MVGFVDENRSENTSPAPAFQTQAVRGWVAVVIEQLAAKLLFCTYLGTGQCTCRISRPAHMKQVFLFVIMNFCDIIPLSNGLFRFLFNTFYSAWSLHLTVHACTYVSMLLSSCLLYSDEVRRCAAPHSSFPRTGKPP